MEAGVPFDFVVDVAARLPTQLIVSPVFFWVALVLWFLTLVTTLRSRLA